MGVPSSLGRAAPRAANHSISFYLIVGLAVPVTCVLALWGLIAGLVLDGRLDRLSWLNTASPGHRTLIGATVIVGAGLLVVITVVIRLAWFARRLAKEISGLTATADALASEQLPRIVTALRDGKHVAEDAGQWPDTKITEIAKASMAIAGLHRAAVAAAVAESGMRDGFRHILVSLGRRNQSLLHRQLRIIDGLERQAADPAALADLFTLDHLTTRMRRHAESLTILSGAAPGRTWSRPVPVLDVMRAATAEVEDYTRVSVFTDSGEAVAAPAVTDMIHLLAELIENATLFSPSSTRVEVRAERVANGFAIEVEDRGLGIPPEQLIQINAQLAHPPDFDLADADRLGLFVAGRLAARHGVQVSLTPSAYRGTKAVVVMPETIIMPAPAQGTAARPAAGADAAFGTPSRLNLGAAEVLTLAGATVPGPAPAETRAETRVETRAEAGAQAQASTTIHGLPRRVRPQPAPDGAPTAVPSVPPEAVPPEHARTLASSLQNSWQRSRQADQAPDLDPDSEEA